MPYQLQIERIEVPPIPAGEFLLLPEDLRTKYGKEHPLFPLATWRDEVAHGDCTEGYWDWVYNIIASWEYTP